MENLVDIYYISIYYSYYRNIFRRKNKGSLYNEIAHLKNWIKIVHCDTTTDEATPKTVSNGSYWEIKNNNAATLKTYTLTLNAVANGYWKVNGVTKAAGSYTYSHGTSLTVECFANDGYVKPTELTMS